MAPAASAGTTIAKVVRRRARQRVSGRLRRFTPPCISNRTECIQLWITASPALQRFPRREFCHQRNDLQRPADWASYDPTQKGFLQVAVGAERS